MTETTADIPRMDILAASDSSLLVVVGETISPEVQRQVLGLFHALQSKQHTYIRNLHPGYVSLLVDFDPLVVTLEQVSALIRQEAGPGIAPQASTTLLEIPVCYGGDFGPDLADVSAHTGLSPDEVVRLHSSVTYDVCFLGFTAGFCFLGGLPPELATPRLATPRRAVPGGSVGMAGLQTGIYPTETPGGWRLIGRTPARMFDPRRAQPTIVLPGDCVGFRPIDRATFERILQDRL